MTHTTISVIIINWNTRDLLENCLRSVAETMPPINHEIFVVDNGSTDGSTNMVRTAFPSVHLVENKENRGFAAANNQALAQMNGDYALLLNSDAVLTEDAAETLLDFMEHTPDAAMVCGQLLNEDGTLQNSIASFPTITTLLMNEALLQYLFPGQHPSKRYRHFEPFEVDSGIGACLMVRKSAIDKVGMFDDNYFFFFEETDWAYRMRRAGWNIYFVPTAYIYHLQGQSAGRSAASRIHFYRSRYRYFRKWHGTLYNRLIETVIVTRLLINWLSTTATVFLTLGLHQQRKHRWLVYTKLILWHLRGRP